MKSLRQFALCSLLLFTISCATSDGTLAPSVQEASLLPLEGTIPPIESPRIRVGLETDSAEAVFPRREGGWFVRTEAGPRMIRRGFTLRAPRAGEPVRWGVRVATFDTEAAARTEAERVRGIVDTQIDVVSGPAGQWRVLVGDFPSSEAGQETRDRLLSQGYAPPLWVVRRPTTASFTRELTLVDDEGGSTMIPGQSVLIQPVNGAMIEIAGKPYRGGARIWISERGLLNLINEVSFEDYLRGVVPGELGPSVYDELEAQKAQAIAARTYAARRLGEYRDEGYDICPTAACQVYSGASIEEKLSDQAIAETAGLVMAWEGEPIDALFTSTCGGETSDVATMFPGRDDPYLKHVRCVELEMAELEGRTDGGLIDETSARAAIFASLAGVTGMDGPSTARDAASAAATVQRISGGGAAAGAPAAATRGGIIRWLASLWGWDSAGMTLTLPEDRAYFFDASRANDPVVAAQSFLIKYGVVPAAFGTAASLDEPMPKREFYAMLFSWLEETGAVTNTYGKIDEIRGDTVRIRGGGEHRIPAGIPLFRRAHESYREQARVPVMIGDRIRIFGHRARGAIGAVVEANYDGASFDRTSSYANWTRSERAPDLVEAIARRVPIRELHGLRPLEVDEANRIARLEVQAENGRTFTLEGIQIRFALGLPDNLFVITRSVDPDGVDRYTFFGKGWGHGTGMCQVGAYGMAVRGREAAEILRHYYTGIEIVPMERLDLTGTAME
ncbi:MAG: SpoIID/LytB domain-containing protein [Thermoanaerobaculia bacterium]